MTNIIKKLKKFFLKNLDKITLLSAISLGGEKALIYIVIIILLFTLTTLNKDSSFVNSIFNKIKPKLEEPIDIYTDTNIDICKNEQSSDNSPPSNNDIKIKNQNEKSNEIKKNIKLLCTKNNKKEKQDSYQNESDIIRNDYELHKTNNFILNVASSSCSTPLFNLRTYKDLNFYYNFIIHDFDSHKINNLIMVKEMQEWTSTSSLSNDDLPDEFCPIYFIKKNNLGVEVYEYLKLFIHTEHNNKVAFITKGVDYLIIKDDINELIEKNLIKDLLCDKKYITYNLLLHDNVTNFLNKILSLVLIPDSLIGEHLTLDIEHYCENKKQYQNFFNTLSSDSSMFNTSL